MNVGIILAAGVGRRINKTMNVSHKCLIKIDGKSFLQNTLEQLDEVCDIIYIALGHESEILENAANEIIQSSNIKAHVEFVNNRLYRITNNITSMKSVFNHMIEMDVKPDKLFYAESDIYYSPEAKLFEAFDITKGNIRGSQFTRESGHNEWMIQFFNDQIHDYVPSDEPGLHVIGLAKYEGQMILDLMYKVFYVSCYDDQIYWDEAERLLLPHHEVRHIELKHDQIFEIDDESDFDNAKERGYNISI